MNKYCNKRKCSFKTESFKISGLEIQYFQPLGFQNYTDFELKM